MFKIRSISNISALAVLSMIGAGCLYSTASQAAECKRTYTIGYSHPVNEAKAVQAVAKYAKLRAQQVGCVNLLLDSTTNLNLQTQRAAVENWVLQGVDAIVIRAVDPTAFARLQKDAQAKGIKWLTYTKPMEGQDGSVGWDLTKAGQLIADDVTAWAKEHYPKGGESAAVGEWSGEVALADQYKIPEAALEKLNIPIVSAQDCNNQECGLSMTESALREHPDLRIFIAGSTDDAGVGAAKAFEKAGIDPKDVYIGGMDGSEQALVDIQKNKYYKATAAIRLDLLGYSIIDASLNAINGKGETNIVSPNQLAKAGDQATLEELIGQYK